MDKNAPRRVAITVRVGSETEVTKKIIRVGAQPVPHYEPVPVTMADGSRVSVLTADVPNQDTQEKIEKIPGVIGVFEDTPIAPFGG